MTTTRIVFQHVSDFVREGVANLRDEGGLVAKEFSQAKNDNGGDKDHTIALHKKAKIISDDTVQFKQLKESIRKTGIVTTYATEQIIPDLINSQHGQYIKAQRNMCEPKEKNRQASRKSEFVTTNTIEQTSPYLLDSQYEQNNGAEKKTHKPEEKAKEKYHKVLIKSEKNGTFTWMKPSNGVLTSKPIKRGSVYDAEANNNNNRRSSIARSA